MNVKLKKIFVVIISIVGVVFVASLGGGSFIVESSLGQKDPKSALDSPEFEKAPELKKGLDEQYYAMKAVNLECYEWLRANSEVVSIKSFDGLKLNAYYKKCEDESLKKNGTVILVHGHKAEPKEMSYYAKNFFERGFDILVIGLRGHSWSEGKVIDFGYYSRYDVKSWADYIYSVNPESKIMIMGVSMGAATTMMACGLGLNENVVCAIEDCGYSSAMKEFAFVMKHDYHLPAFPILHIGVLYNRIKNGFWVTKITPAEDLKKSKVPMLFIHGDKDTYVPYWMLDENYNSFDGEKEIFVVDGGIHATNPMVDPEKYWNRIDSFVGKYF